MSYSLDKQEFLNENIPVEEEHNPMLVKTLIDLAQVINGAYQKGVGDEKRGRNK